MLCPCVPASMRASLAGLVSLASLRGSPRGVSRDQAQGGAITPTSIQKNKKGLTLSKIHDKIQPSQERRVDEDGSCRDDQEDDEE